MDYFKAYFLSLLLDICVFCVSNVNNLYTEQSGGDVESKEKKSAANGANKG